MLAFIHGWAAHQAAQNLVVLLDRLILHDTE
jgi:hypothetical protein